MKFKSINLATGILLTASLGVITGCSEKDLYEGGDGSSQQKPSSEYFDFATRGDIKLKVNYNAPGFVAYIEVYNENPIEVIDGKKAKKEGLQPVYSAFTKDGKLDVNMYIPTAVKEAYLYTDRLGLPQCVKLTSEEDGFSYNATVNSVRTRATVAEMENWFTGEYPYKLYGADRYAIKEAVKKSFYTINKWGPNGVIYNENNYLKDNGITFTESVNNVSIANISNRVQNAFDNASVDVRKSWLSSADITNIKTTENDTELDVVFLGERGEYNNTLGYYYYPTDQGNNIDKIWSSTGDEFFGYKTDIIPMYVIFPNASGTLEDGSNIIKCGETIRLKYIDENGNVKDKFPAGYTVGWFYIRNGYISNPTQGNEALKDKIIEVDYNVTQRIGTWSCSNENADKQRFVSLYDNLSKTLVIGFEDHQVGGEDVNDDYSDVLFFVKSNKDLSEEHPTLPPGGDDKPGTFTLSGTLAFEDIWPWGGDYDMNDVVVEYDRTFTFDKNNNVTHIKEVYTPVHNGAAYNNLFAIQAGYWADGLKLSDGCKYEEETKSVILTEDIKTILNKSFTIERNVSGQVNKDEAMSSFNPYIIIDGAKKGTDVGRSEVHLPKKDGTEKAAKRDNNTVGDNAYFIHKDGKYSFAIDIPVKDFKVVTETITIGSKDNEYPLFKTWADSKGTDATDWYLYKDGKK